MNCRLFSQHENYTTESQIVKLIYDTDKYCKIKVKLFRSAFLCFINTILYMQIFLHFFFKFSSFKQYHRYKKQETY